MLRYHLPKLRASRNRNRLEGSKKTNVDFRDDFSEETTLSIQVQLAASRDEIETSTEERFFQDKTRSPSQVDNDSPSSAENHLMPSRGTSQSNGSGDILRKIRKLGSNFAKNSTKLARKNKETRDDIMTTNGNMIATGSSHTVAKSVMPVKLPVLVSSEQGSVSTLSCHADAVPTVPPLRPEVKAPTSFELETREGGEMIGFDLKFDDMSFADAGEKSVAAAPTNAYDNLRLSSRPVLPTDIWCACRVGDEGFVRGALAHNSEILMQTYQGRTPLYCAAHAGQAHVVKLLLDMGATDHDGTAFLSALNGDCRKLLTAARCENEATKRLDSTTDLNSNAQGRMRLQIDDADCSIAANGCDMAAGIAALLPKDSSASQAKGCDMVATIAALLPGASNKSQAKGCDMTASIASLPPRNSTALHVEECEMAASIAALLPEASIASQTELEKEISVSSSVNASEFDEQITFPQEIETEFYQSFGLRSGSSNSGVTGEGGTGSVSSIGDEESSKDVSFRIASGEMVSHTTSSDSSQSGESEDDNDDDSSQSIDAMDKPGPTSVNSSMTRTNGQSASDADVLDPLSWDWFSKMCECECECK